MSDKTTFFSFRETLSYFYSKISEKFDVFFPSTGGTITGDVKVEGKVSANQFEGSATSAGKLNTNAGSATQPVYFSGGVPVKTTHTLGASVPADAKFTDTTYKAATTSADGLMSAGDKSLLTALNERVGDTSVAEQIAASRVTDVHINELVDAALEEYLPLTGGTVTGSVMVQKTLTADKVIGAVYQ